MAIQKSERAKVTYLLHEANLSHERLVAHLSNMAALGLIGRKMDGEIVYYTIAQKGEKYLMEFRKVKEFGDAFGVEV